MAHDLPAAVRTALAARVEGRRLAPLKAAHSGVSDHYRAGGASSGTIDTDEAVLAYALARMPATHAAVGAALAALDAACPDLAPTDALDIGCGPGTALIAALGAYPDLAGLTGIDHNPRFLRFAAEVMHAAGLAAGRRLAFEAGDSARAGTAADLVLSSYALVERSDADARAAVRHAWSLTRQALVLVEPGSRAGFARIRMARTELIGQGAAILAPCTHQAPCPMADPDWCHVSVRVQRSREHRLLKGGDAPFEDEKFSYLVAARAAPPPAAALARIVAPPFRSKAGLRLAICHADGLEARMVPARSPAIRTLRKVDWGDLITLSPPD